MFNKKTKLDYTTDRPDHSIIEVRRGFELIGTIQWDTIKHSFLYQSTMPTSSDELKDIVESIVRLNKAAIPPQGLAWK